MPTYGQPVISRETRRLLITVMVSIAALWLLARMRFQERSEQSLPVPPMLAQLRPTTGYSDLARVIADLRPTLTAAIVESDGSPSLRLSESTGIALRTSPGGSEIARDRATGLSIVPLEPGIAPGLMPWAPRLLEYPRYLVAVDLAGERISLRPVFVGGLFPSASPLWPDEIWGLPPTTHIATGTFIFTTEGALAGLSVEHGGFPAILPAAVLLKMANELSTTGDREDGEIGVTVQPLSKVIALASGASKGMVVTSVEAGSAASGVLHTTDIIEAIDGKPLTTAEDWRARVGRLRSGDAVSLQVRTNGQIREVTIVARPGVNQPPPVRLILGLRLRRIPGVGSEVIGVQSPSLAQRSDIREGDIVTVAGTHTAPTPAEVTNTFGTLPQDAWLLLAITRGTEHRVVAIEKRAVEQ